MPHRGPQVQITAQKGDQARASTAPMVHDSTNGVADRLDDRDVLTLVVGDAGDKRKSVPTPVQCFHQPVE